MGKGLSMAEIKFDYNLDPDRPQRRNIRGTFTFSNGVSVSVSKANQYSAHMVRVSIVDERTGRDVTDEFTEDVEVYGRRIENGCMDSHNLLEKYELLRTVPGQSASLICTNVLIGRSCGT